MVMSTLSSIWSWSSGLALAGSSTTITNASGSLEVLVLLLRNLSRASLYDCIKSYIHFFFFLLSLPEAYFLDDMLLLEFRETISNNNFIK
jgi:hypothetical protein